MNKSNPQLTVINNGQVPELPVPRETRLVQAEVPRELFEAVHRELEGTKQRGKKKTKINEAVKWGLQAYLLNVNPKAAERLGIVARAGK